MQVRYSSDLEDFKSAEVEGFFDGWPEPPDNLMFRHILEGSQHVVLALDGDRLIGFCTALTDGVLCAFIPLLEVHREYRGKGIGTELVRAMLGHLDGLYSIDVVCDEDVAGFYERLGFLPLRAMSVRDYSAQSGRG